MNARLFCCWARWASQDGPSAEWQFSLRVRGGQPGWFAEVLALDVIRDTLLVDIGCADLWICPIVDDGPLSGAMVCLAEIVGTWSDLGTLVLNEWRV